MNRDKDLAGPSSIFTKLLDLWDIYVCRVKPQAQGWTSSEALVAALSRVRLPGSDRDNRAEEGPAHAAANWREGSHKFI